MICSKLDIVLTEQPAPEIKTSVVSEVTFTKDQLVELIRTHYGADVIPHVKVEADAVYGCGKLAYVKFSWSNSAPCNHRPDT